MVLNSSLIKTLSGNDKVTARYMYENSFEFVASFKIWLNTNHLPQITDDTVFKSGRVVVIPFNRHFSEEEQKVGLKAELTKPEVLSAVLNWCIKGFQDVIMEGKLEMPNEIQQAVQEYQTENDRLGEFLEDCYIQDMDNKKQEKISEVYRLYVTWCRCNNYKSLNKKRFISKLNDRTVIQLHNNQKYSRFGSVN